MAPSQGELPQSTHPDITHYAVIANGDNVEILCGLPEGSRLSPTLFGICAAELNHELRTKLPAFKFDRITSVDDFN